MPKLSKTVRELDDTRLVTYATNHGKTDVCFYNADFISINTYPGWYGNDNYKAWDKEIKMLRSYADSVGQKDKPMIISEFGAGDIKEDTSFDGMLWSETYQNNYFEYALSFLGNSEDVTGMIIWQYCDMRTSEKRDVALGRPRNYNNKGLLNEYRIPKLAYHTVKRIYNDLKLKYGK